jgi:heme-degrading monooxygenase HmoA
MHVSLQNTSFRIKYIDFIDLGNVQHFSHIFPRKFPSSDGRRLSGNTSLFSKTSIPIGHDLPIQRQFGTRFLFLRHHKPSCATIMTRLGQHMFVVVWQFEIAEEKIAAFEAAYSPEGTWAKMFSASPDYRGTELLCDAYIPGNYLTIDRWASEDAFRAFRKDHDQEYEILDRACDELTSSETRIGAYTACVPGGHNATLKLR